MYTGYRERTVNFSGGRNALFALYLPIIKSDILSGGQKAMYKANRPLTILIYSTIALTLIGSIFLLVKLSPHLVWIWTAAKAVLTPLVISVIIAYLLNPIVAFLHQRKVPRGVAVVVIYTFFSLFIIVMLMNIVPAFISQSKDLTEHLPGLFQTYETWLNELHTHKHDLPDGLRKGIDQFLLRGEERTSRFFTNLLDGATGMFEKLVQLFVLPFLIFYLLKDMSLLQRSCLLFVPRKQRKIFTRLFQDIDVALGSYIRGQLWVCLLVGILAYIGYLIIGLPYALLLSLFVFVTNIIPYIGPLIGAAPAALVAATISWKVTALVLGVNFMIQILEGNIISPMIMGKSLHLHPLAVILALLLGEEMGGLAGLIFAVPIFAILRVIWQHLLVHLVKH
jgi:predicted PurR-regulated permease PerM